MQRELTALGEAGYKEVTLLGQNVDAYGRDLPGMAADGSGRRRWTFTDLLRYVHDVPGIERIRFATSHPRCLIHRDIRGYVMCRSKVKKCAAREHDEGLWSVRRYFTDRLVKACSELPKMCEFFHVPFQSGDDHILREMR